MASASNRAPEIYWTSFSMSIVNVGSKFTNKESVSSRPFRCERDNRPLYMEMCLHFGIRQGKETWLSAFVKSSTGEITLRKLKFTLLDNQGVVLKSAHDPDLNKTATKGHSFGFDEFFDADILANPDDIVWRIVCEIEYDGPLPVEQLSLSPNSNLENDYLQLFENAENSDITFNVQDVQIRAHKTILIARSVYFRNMFDSRMNEAETGKIDVPDADPSAFRGMLQYIYGGASPKNLNDIVIDLYALADKYGLKNLLEICESFLQENLDADNVVEVLLLADKYSLEELKSKAKVVMKANLFVLQQSEENRKKLEQRPSLLLDLVIFYAAQ